MTEPVRQVCLAARPDGMPKASDFNFTEGTIGSPAEGEILVRVLYLSLDPALRPRMNAESAYAGAVALGEVIPSSGLGVVVQSQSPLFVPGDHVFGMVRWQSHAILPATEARRIDPARAPLPKWLSLLGLSSFTAWIGMTEIGRPQRGETAVISAAAGATGAIAGQIARIAGTRAVGIAGGSEKCRHVVETYGFDACVDYRAPDFLEQLDAACPNGVDVNYENVGGNVLRAVYDRMNVAGRVILCGLVSEYSSPTGFGAGPSLWPAIYKSLRIEGFRASRHWHRVPEFVEQALTWSAEGLLTHEETIADGLQAAPQAFVEMLSGRNLGKAMVRL
jgi:hypothetical protein